MTKNGPVPFSCPSTGAYAYPLDEASRVALTAVRDFLVAHGRPEVVRFALLGEAFGAFSAALEELR